MVLILGGKFNFFALKILGSREWKIQMSTLDTSPDHNHHLFSYSVTVQELHEVGHISIQERLPLYLCSHSEFSSPQTPMPSSGRELYMAQNTGSRGGLVVEQGHEAVHTTSASAVLPVPPHGVQAAQQPWFQQSYFLRQHQLQKFHLICPCGMVWTAWQLGHFFWEENLGIMEQLESLT